MRRAEDASNVSGFIFQRTASVSFALQLNFSPEYAVYEDEIGESQRCTQDPPRKPDDQAMMSRSRIVDGQAVSGVRACGQHQRIKTKDRDDEHAGDVDA